MVYEYYLLAILRLIPINPRKRYLILITNDILLDRSIFIRLFFFSTYEMKCPVLCGIRVSLGLRIYSQADLVSNGFMVGGDRYSSK